MHTNTLQMPMIFLRLDRPLTEYGRGIPTQQTAHLNPVAQHVQPQKISRDAEDLQTHVLPIQLSVNQISTLRHDPVASSLPIPAAGIERAAAVQPKISLSSSAAITRLSPLDTQISQEYDPNPQYTFAYDVEDNLTGDSKSHQERRNGDVVSKNYYPSINREFENIFLTKLAQKYDRLI